MDKVPLCSVITPTYNGSGFLGRSIGSVLNQSYGNIEMLLLDDCSQDDSIEASREAAIKELDSYEEYELGNERIIEGYKKGAKRKVRIFDNSEQGNKGAPARYNEGVEFSEGTYISILDQDDWLPTDFIKTFMDTAAATDTDAVLGGYRRVRSDGTVIREEHRTALPFSKYVLTAAWAGIYRRDFILQNNIKFLETEIGEDIYFSISVYTKTTRIAYINKEPYYWSYNERSVSNTVQRSVNDFSDPYILLNRLYEDIPKNRYTDKEMLEYYIIRYAFWFFSFAAKGSTSEDLKHAYDKMYSWLKEHYPEYRKNRYLVEEYPQGEPRYIGVPLRVYMKAERLGIALPLIIMYSKLR